MWFKTHHVPRYVLYKYISFHALRNPTKWGLFPETRSRGVRQSSTNMQLVAESESHLGFWSAQPIFPSVSLATVPTATPRSLRVLTGPVLSWGRSNERGDSWRWVWPLPEAMFSGRLQSWVVSQPHPLPTYPCGCQTQRHHAGGTPARLLVLEPALSPRPFSPVSIWPTDLSPAPPSTRPRRHNFSLARSPTSPFVLVTNSG